MILRRVSLSSLFLFFGDPSFFFFCDDLGEEWNNNNNNNNSSSNNNVCVSLTPLVSFFFSLVPLSG